MSTYGPEKEGYIADYSYPRAICCAYCILQTGRMALAGVAQWIERQPVNQRDNGGKGFQEQL